MKTTQQHLEALLAAEGDQQFDGVVKSVKQLRQKQSVESQSTTFQWIKTSRELSELERKLSDQLKRMQTDLGLLSHSSQEEHECDALTLVIGLRNALELTENSDKPRHREMILDMKQRLNEMQTQLDQQCLAVEEETRTQRNLVLKLVSDGNKQCNIPPSLLKALESLYTLGDEDSNAEVEFLKQEMLEELGTAKQIRIEQLKKKWLDKIERLRKRIVDKTQRNATKAKNEARQQEFQAQLKQLRLERQLRAKQNQQESSTPNCKVGDEKVVGVRKRLENMQALARHHLDRVQDHEKENAEVLLQDEIMKERRRCFNKERSSFREEQRGRKLIAKQEATAKMKREQEVQLERLASLAMTCPYQKTITDLRPDIHKTTNARHHDFYRKNNLPDFQANRHSSFTDEKIFSDQKFRLAQNLHEAGINKTIAARDIVRNVIPRNAERTTGIKPY